MYLYWTRATTMRYAYGTAWFSLSLNNTVTSANEISGTFIAKGPWKILSAVA
jgi:hypothetical protein